MDHAEARDVLEVAAAEPGGLERLMAGDTPEAAALAGHLAGCPACAAEMTRLRTDAAIIGEVVRTLPPAGLRERTLAYVAALGTDRSAGALRTEPDVRVLPAAAHEPPDPADRDASRGGGRRTLGWLAAVAAAVIVAIAGTGLLVGSARDAQLAARDAELARQAPLVGALERVATWSLRIADEPDAQHVRLTAGDGSTAAGRLLYSPRTRDLVVVASGLPEPPPGREFRCWVEVDGRRFPVGRMVFASGVQFWVGPVDEVADLPAGASFGVTLVDAAGESLDGPPTLGGSL